MLKAQIKHEFSFGIAIPQGYFGMDNFDKAIFNGYGEASTGLILQYKLLYPLNAKNLFVTFNTGVIYNDVQKYFKEEYEDMALDEDDIYELPKYLNFPVLAGLQFEQPISNNIGFYAGAEFGVNLLKITDLWIEGSDGYENITFRPSAGLGIKLGGGFTFNKKFIININYLHLGNHQVEFLDTYEDYNNDNYSYVDRRKFLKPLPVHLLNITFSIRI